MDRSRFRLDSREIWIRDGSVAFRTDSDGWVDATHPNATPPIEALARDAEAVHDGAFEFEFLPLEGFFERIEGGTPRAGLVQAIRGSVYSTAQAKTVEHVTTVNPRDGAALLPAMGAAFVETTHYDGLRYGAGAIDDNLLPWEANLRAPLVPDSRWEALAEGGRPALFCGEYTRLANRAIHAVSPLEQTPPLAGGLVRDDRHKHLYNAIASAIRLDGSLVVPVTFVDYTYPVLYADVRLQGLLGTEIDAYDEWHRADEVRW